jgi:hypothetical protein
VERFPDEYRPIVRRLQQAVADMEVREAMEMEDDVTEHFRIEERKKDMIIAEKEAALAENKAALAEKEAALAEDKAALARERAEKEALLARLAALEASSQTGEK